MVSVIKGYGLQRFVFFEFAIPPRFLLKEDAQVGNMNKAFVEWEQQNQLLLSWLLSSISEKVLSSLVGCETSFQVWVKLEQYFCISNQG